MNVFTKRFYERAHCLAKGTRHLLLNLRNWRAAMLFACLLSWPGAVHGAAALDEQQRTEITGRVTDGNTGEPLFGASVALVGTARGTTTDFDGNYTLTVPPGEGPTVQLQAGYIGYAPITVSVSLTRGGIVTADFALEQITSLLGEVMVSANKRDERLQDLPYSVQALTSEALEQSGIRDISEVIAFVPGASEDLSFGAGLRQYQLRGIPQGPGDPTVGYYMDDIPFNFFGFRYAPLGRTFDVSRVEVLRGPQSTLYGAGAMGGVMKFVTNKPDLYKFGGKAVSGATLLEDKEPGYYTDLAVNIPLIREKLGIRVTGSLEEIGGYADTNPALMLPEARREGAVSAQFRDQLPPEAKNANPTELAQFRGQLLYQPTEDLQVRLSYSNAQNEQRGGTFLSVLEPEILLGSANDTRKVNWEVFSGTLQYDFDFATLTTTTSALKAKTVVETSIYLGDVFGTGTPVGAITSTAAGELKGFNQETRLVSNGDGPLKWLAGFYYVQSDVDGSTVITPPSPFFPSSSTISKSVSPSFFGEVSYGFFDNKLIALAGLRYFRDKRTFTENGSAFSATTSMFEPFMFNRKNTFTSINPRFNLSFRPDDNSNFYVNVAKGFRGGKFNANAVVVEHNSTFGLPAVITIEPDEIWNYEVGTKLQLANNQLSVELAAYRQNWSNAILQFAVVSFADYNAGDVVGQGIDLELAYAPANTPLTFKVTGNVNNTEFNAIKPALLEEVTRVPDNPATPEDETVIIPPPLGFKNGDAYPFVPEFTLAASLNYSQAIGSGGWATNNTVSFSYRGKQPGNGDIVSGPLTLLGLRLGVSKDNVGFTIFGNNLLNDRSAQYSQRTPALTAFTGILPRQYGLQISYSF